MKRVLFTALFIAAIGSASFAQTAPSQTKNPNKVVAPAKAPSTTPANTKKATEAKSIEKKAPAVDAKAKKH